MSQTSSSSNLHDMITEESPPAYTPYPNSGEQSMAFGPNRPFVDNATQSIPQQQQNNYQENQNQHINHINQPPLRNYDLRYHNYNSNSVYGVRGPSHTSIPINTQVITTPFRYITNQINHLTSSVTNNNFVQVVRPQNNVKYVTPGDPSIGGLLCPNCRGSGKSSNQQLCTRCQGVGRIFN